MNPSESRTETGGGTAQYAEMWQKAWEPYLRMFQQMAPANTAIQDLGKLQQRYLEFASSEGAAAYRTLSQLSADYYSAVLNTGVKLSEEFYRQVYQANPRTPAPAPRPAPPAQELVFAGTIGSTASRAFVISNRSDQPVKVGFELSEFVKSDGAGKVRLDARLTPSSLELPGHGEQTVECAIPLSDALEPETEYRAVLRVSGFPDMKIGLVVKAQSAPTVAAPSVVSEPAKPRAAKRKR